MLSSCATIKSLDAQLPVFEKSYLYSGTRLDWAGITENTVRINKFKVRPPYCPGCDLPFSFALDSLLLPLTLSAEIFH